MASKLTLTIDLDKLAVELVPFDPSGITADTLAYAIRTTLEQVGRGINAEEVESRGFQFCAPLCFTGRHDDDAAPAIGTVKFS